jgi:hypothetical protein
MVREFVHGMLSVEQRTHDPKPRVIGQKLEDRNRSGNLLLGWLSNYLRSHTDSINYPNHMPWSRWGGSAVDLGPGATRSGNGELTSDGRMIACGCRKPDRMSRGARTRESVHREDQASALPRRSIKGWRDARTG